MAWHNDWKKNYGGKADKKRLVILPVIKPKPDHPLAAPVIVPRQPTATVSPQQGSQLVALVEDFFDRQQEFFDARRLYDDVNNEMDRLKKAERELKSFIRKIKEG